MLHAKEGRTVGKQVSLVLRLWGAGRGHWDWHASLGPSAHRSRGCAGAGSGAARPGGELLWLPGLQWRAGVSLLMHQAPMVHLGGVGGRGPLASWVRMKACRELRT